MKIKLDKYNLGVVIEAIYKYRHCTEATSNEIDTILNLIVRLGNEYENIKTIPKKKFEFKIEEIRTITKSLIEWRNAEIRAGNDVAIDFVTETLILFLGV